MEVINPPKGINLHGKVAEEWRRFQQNLEIFLKGDDHTTKANDVQVAILLNCLGEPTVKLF